MLLEYDEGGGAGARESRDVQAVGYTKPSSSDSCSVRIKCIIIIIITIVGEPKENRAGGIIEN